MVSFLQAHQLNIMLVMSGVCGVIAFFCVIGRSMHRRRRVALALMEICAMALLIFDRFAYLYRGDVSQTGYYMVRISNFLVFLVTILMMISFNSYVQDLIIREGGLEKTPRRLILVYFLCALGIVLLVISQFTGLYYTFDEMNRYQRSGGFLICYLIPMVCLLIDLSVIIQHVERVNTLVRISLILFAIAPIAASVVQVFMYGVSLTNLSCVGMAVALYVFALIDMDRAVERGRILETNYLKEVNKRQQLLFMQTTTALTSAIDAKDVYSHGHSVRVAEYSRKLGEMMGKSEEECNEIYYAALLHDVGKIGIDGRIINKVGKLTDEEFEEMKKHSEMGNQILSSITEYPFLSIGARYHHEHYDGTGYPAGLKGEDIPEIARIISIADAYDAMTSKRSYRDPIPQQKVREEFVKYAGTQFDPNIAKQMLHLIDLDTEYQMREKEEIRELSGTNELYCEEYRSAVSEGIVISPNTTTIRLRSLPDENAKGSAALPALILFDSLDARVHTDEANIRELGYYEYAEVWFDGHAISSGARMMEAETEPLMAGTPADMETRGATYEIEAVKYQDHIRIRVKGAGKRTEVIVALPDSSRFAYLSLTGEHCHIRDVEISKAEQPIGEYEIPRIAEEVSYIDRIAGDVPNIQINGYRTASTEGIPIRDGMQITFHTMSLPTARLVWHCPFIDIFTSANGQVDGPNYREFALIRLDGEHWESDDEVKQADNRMMVSHTDAFEGWENWKECNKKGFDCSVTFLRRGNKFTAITENLGIAIKNITTIPDVDEVYVSLTGDQCALTDIRIEE